MARDVFYVKYKDSFFEVGAIIKFYKDTYKIFDYNEITEFLNKSSPLTQNRDILVVFINHKNVVIDDKFLDGFVKDDPTRILDKTVIFLRKDKDTEFSKEQNNNSTDADEDDSETVELDDEDIKFLETLFNDPEMMVSHNNVKIKEAKKPEIRLNEDDYNHTVRETAEVLTTERAKKKVEAKQNEQYPSQKPNLEQSADRFSAWSLLGTVLIFVILATLVVEIMNYYDRNKDIIFVQRGDTLYTQFTLKKDQQTPEIHVPTNCIFIIKTNHLIFYSDEMHKKIYDSHPNIGFYPATPLFFLRGMNDKISTIRIWIFPKNKVSIFPNKKWYFPMPN